MDCSPPGSSIHGILLARMLEWVAISSSRGSSWLRDWILVSCIAGRFFTTEPSGKHYIIYNKKWDWSFLRCHCDQHCVLWGRKMVVMWLWWWKEYNFLWNFKCKHLAFCSTENESLRQVSWLILGHECWPHIRHFHVYWLRFSLLSHNFLFGSVKTYSLYLCYNTHHICCIRNKFC